MVSKDWSEKGVGILKLNMDSKLKKYRLSKTAFLVIY